MQNSYKIYKEEGGASKYNHKQLLKVDLEKNVDQFVVENMLTRANLMKGIAGLYQRRNDGIKDDAGERDSNQILHDASDRMGQAKVMMTEHNRKNR